MNTPNLKWESPPTQSEDHFGNPDQQYTSLFGMGMDAGTPQSYDDDSMFGESMMSDNTPVPEGDSGKKPVKKRKSWGQQLPEPKTNLPPRKRAKTEDEKEQRRVERVLRNRRAAQSSRERKRQEVEALEAEKRAIEDRNCLLEEELATSRSHDAVLRKNRELENLLVEAQQQVAVMRQQLAAATGGNMTTFHGASAPTTAHTEQFRSTPSPVTLSQELFSSLGAPAELSTLSTMPIHTPAAESETVNPASLSPQTQPVLDESVAAPLDLTQQPAALLCDLQCQPRGMAVWTPSMLLLVQFLAMMSAASSTILNSLMPILDSLRTGSSLPPTLSNLTTLIWMLTTTSTLTTTSSKTTSTTTRTTSPRPRLSLRISLLNRMLSCSPQLARPLMDATLAEMRFVSKQQASNDCSFGMDWRDRSTNGRPSVETLATLLWAIQCFVKQYEQQQQQRRNIVSVDVRQLSWELGNLFGQRRIKMARANRKRFSSMHGGAGEQNVLGLGRTALG